MIFDEPPEIWDHHGNEEYEKKITYTETIQLVPEQKYWIKLDVLRNDLGDSGEEVSAIEINGQDFGKCKPDGGDYDCTFFNCKNELITNQIATQDGRLQVAITFQGHSHDCDCDKSTWRCKKEGVDQSLSPIVAAARITLSPFGKKE